MIPKISTNETCGDCDVEPRQFHREHCDVARCPSTGRQRLSCDCDGDDYDNCPCDVWTGEWPGSAECREFDFWSRADPKRSTGEYWVRCDKDHPDAWPDLNRLHADAKWNAHLGRWVLKKKHRKAKAK
jgi:hypothetical protein